jgi:hypothetical protein
MTLHIFSRPNSWTELSVCPPIAPEPQTILLSSAITKSLDHSDILDDGGLRLSFLGPLAAIGDNLERQTSIKPVILARDETFVDDPNLTLAKENSWFKRIVNWETKETSRSVQFNPFGKSDVSSDCCIPSISSDTKNHHVRVFTKYHTDQDIQKYNERIRERHSLFDSSNLTQVVTSFFTVRSSFVFPVTEEGFVLEIHLDSVLLASGKFYEMGTLKVYNELTPLTKEGLKNFANSSLPLLGADICIPNAPAFPKICVALGDSQKFASLKSYERTGLSIPYSEHYARWSASQIDVEDL